MGTSQGGKGAKIGADEGVMSVSALANAGCSGHLALACMMGVRIGYILFTVVFLELSLSFVKIAPAGRFLIEEIGAPSSKFLDGSKT